MCCKNTNAKETHFGACCSRPDLYGIIIPGKHGKLLATLYTAGGEGPHPTILLLHGIPGSEQNLDLAQAFRRAGFHVMTFHYSGSWGSSGNYSLQNDLDDAETVLDFILTTQLMALIKIRSMQQATAWAVLSADRSQQEDRRSKVLFF